MAHYKLPVVEDYFPTTPKLTQEQIIEKVITELTLQMETELAYEEKLIAEYDEHCKHQLGPSE